MSSTSSISTRQRTSCSVVIETVMCGMSMTKTTAVPLTQGTWATWSRERWLKIDSGWMRGMMRGRAKSSDMVETWPVSLAKSWSR